MDLGAFMCALKYSGRIICNLYKIPQRISSQPNLITGACSWPWYWIYIYTFLWKIEDYMYNNKHWRVKTIYILWTQLKTWHWRTLNVHLHNIYVKFHSSWASMSMNIYTNRLEWRSVDWLDDSSETSCCCAMCCAIDFA